jgi:hypothetical protein
VCVLHTVVYTAVVHRMVYTYGVRTLRVLQSRLVSHGYSDSDIDLGG